jgi:predicted TIM-barrel fold metal-dependent hydrolase
MTEKCGPFKQSLTHYFNTNFWLTTAGVTSDSALAQTLRVIGEGRVLFSVDYPYEGVIETLQWFDGLEMSQNTKKKLGAEKAKALLRL